MPPPSADAIRAVPPERAGATGGAPRHAPKIVDPQPELLLRRLPGAEEHQPRRPRAAGHRVHRPVGLRQVDAAAHLQPHVRALSRASAPKARSLLDGENILDRGRTSTCCAPRIGMVFQKPTPFPMSIYDNIAFGVRLYETLPRSRDGRARRVGAAARRRCGTRSRTSCSQSGLGPLGRPAAAPVHRARRRDQARGAAARRAVLGARPDLDRQDRGADRRAEGRLHDRDRHPQHAAGGAHLATTPPSCTWAS